MADMTDTFGKCRKHGCWLKTREMHDGKTMQVCPECEAEQHQRMRAMLRDKIIEQDAARGRPLTDWERLENLSKALREDDP
jgi:hypothetical protein